MSDNDIHMRRSRSFAAKAKHYFSSQNILTNEVPHAELEIENRPTEVSSCIVQKTPVTGHNSEDTEDSVNFNSHNPTELNDRCGYDDEGDCDINQQTNDDKYCGADDDNDNTNSRKKSGRKTGYRHDKFDKYFDGIKDVEDQLNDYNEVIIKPEICTFDKMELDKFIREVRFCGLSRGLEQDTNVKAKAHSNMYHRPEEQLEETETGIIDNVYNKHPYPGFPSNTDLSDIPYFEPGDQFHFFQHPGKQKRLHNSKKLLFTTMEDAVTQTEEPENVSEHFTRRSSGRRVAWKPENENIEIEYPTESFYYDDEPESYIFDSSLNQPTARVKEDRRLSIVSDLRAKEIEIGKHGFKYLPSCSSTILRHENRESILNTLNLKGYLPKPLSLTRESTSEPFDNDDEILQKTSSSKILLNGCNEVMSKADDKNGNLPTPIHKNRPIVLKKTLSQHRRSHKQVENSGANQAKTTRNKERRHIGAETGTDQGPFENNNRHMHKNSSSRMFRNDYDDSNLRINDQKEYLPTTPLRKTESNSHETFTQPQRRYKQSENSGAYHVKTNKIKERSNIIDEISPGFDKKNKVVKLPEIAKTTRLASKNSAQQFHGSHQKVQRHGKAKTNTVFASGVKQEKHWNEDEDRRDFDARNKVQTHEVQQDEVYRNDENKHKEHFNLAENQNRRQEAKAHVDTHSDERENEHFFDTCKPERNTMNDINTENENENINQEPDNDDELKSEDVANEYESKENNKRHKQQMRDTARFRKPARLKTAKPEKSADEPLRKTFENRITDPKKYGSLAHMRQIKEENKYSRARLKEAGTKVSSWNESCDNNSNVNSSWGDERMTGRTQGTQNLVPTRSKRTSRLTLGGKHIQAGKQLKLPGKRKKPLMALTKDGLMYATYTYV